MIQAHIQVQREMKVQSIPDCNKTLGLANLPWPGLEGTAQLLWFVSIPNWPWSPGPHHTKDRKSILWDLWELSYSIHIIVIAVPSLSHVQFFVAPWTAVRQASLSFTIFPKLAQTHAHWVGDAIQPSHPVTLLSCPQSFPASECFSMSRFFKSTDQGIGASASSLYI